MKLLSVKNRNKTFEAKLDIGLITSIEFDKNEVIYIIEYDASDVGLPLGINIPIDSAKLYIKITGEELYADMAVEFGEFDDEIDTYVSDDDMMAEFHLQLTEEEKLKLLMRLLIEAQF